MKNQILKSNGSREAKILTILGLLLLLAGSSAAQYGGSLSSMFDTIRTANQNLFDEQRRLNELENRINKSASSGSSSVQSAQRFTTQAPARQYPLTATDFLASANHLLPDALADSATGVTPEVREAMRGLYKNTLAAFEKEARKNNMANAFAFVVGVSIQIVDGKELSDDYTNKMIAYFNNRLASAPQYTAMSNQQKQALYESLVICGGVIVFLDAQGKQANNAQMQSQARDASRAVIKQFLGIDAR